MATLKANLTVALGYVIAGQLGLLLALPPGNASPIWPAAGVALAAMLLQGRRIIPGLLAGAIAAQFLSYLDPSSAQSLRYSFYIAIILAIGSVLQAWAGAYLITKYVGQADPLTRDGKIIRFLLLGGPVSCMVAASIGVPTIYLVDVIRQEEILLTWSTWWVGDTIGVLVVTPVLIILLARPRTIWQGRVRAVVYPLLLLLLMVVLLFIFGKQQDMNRIENEFQRQSHLLSHILADRMSHHMETNRVLKAYFDSSGLVNEYEFENFTQHILYNRDTVQALEWIPRVKSEAVPLLLRDWPMVSTLTEFDGETNVVVSERDEYYPIRFVSPYVGNERALGFDVASNPLARDALLRARDSGQTAVTVPLRLVQDSAGSSGIVLYSPIYAGADDWPDVTLRREKMLGVVANVFRVSDELQHVFRSFDDIKLNVSIFAGSSLVYEITDPSVRHDLGNINLIEKFELPVADKTWQVTITPAAAFFRDQLYWHTWWLLLGGLLLAIFAGAGLMMLVGRTMRTEDLVRQRTGELETEINERLQVMEAKEKQNLILRTVVSSAPQEEVLNLIARITEAANPDMLCSILLLDEDGEHVHNGAAPSLPAFFVNAVEGEKIGPRAGSCGTAMYTRQRVIVEDIEQDPLWEDYRELARQAGLRACWSEPILSANQQVLGSFAVYYKEPRSPSAEDLQRIQDISHLVSIAIERKQSESQIQRLAFFDVLTDLPNRRLLQDRLMQELATVKRNNTHGALLFIDLDNFKNLNDSLGHQFGDKLLVKVATRLRKCIRDEDTAARLGGDEFIILLRNTDANVQRITEHAGALAQRIKSELNKPYNLDGYTHHISPSIGITLFSRDNNDPETLLKQADTAMYSAKARGRNAICYYHPDMQKQADRRLQMEKDLRQAINEHQFSLHYQPQYNEQLEIVSAEALLRWNHPVHGLVAPGEFIPMAEESDLILIISEWVMEEVCRQLNRWPQLDYISINISPSQIQQADFVANLSRMLQRFNIPGQRLMLEMTESIMITDIDNATDKMRAIQQLGVGLSIDDFGTGYSSLVYLKTLPINQLKIDKGFIGDIVADADDRMIVETIISMAHHLRLDVVAEGVETRAQLDFLRQHQCNIYQGYYFSPALAVSGFEQMLSASNNTGKLVKG